MLMPKKYKFKKQHRLKHKGNVKRFNNVSFGYYGFMAIERGFLTARQIEATRIVINRCIKKNSQIWIRIFPDRPLTKKPAEVRMGKGAGGIDKWICIIKPGKIIYEIDYIENFLAIKAIKLANAKLPIKIKLITRDL